MTADKTDERDSTGGTHPGTEETAPTALGRKRRRWAVLLAAGSLAVAVVWGVGQRRITAMRAEITDRSHALLGPPTTRTTPASTRPGSALQAMLAIYPVFVDELKAWEYDRNEALFSRCSEVRDGKRPLAELPPRCRAIFKRLSNFYIFLTSSRLTLAHPLAYTLAYTHPFELMAVAGGLVFRSLAALARGRRRRTPGAW